MLQGLFVPILLGALASGPGAALRGTPDAPDEKASVIRKETHKVAYQTVKIDGLDISYREAGPKDAPAILLLHGFPTSSHMYRNLIPALSDNYHLIAPDYPGYGQSSAPPRDQFTYTFDNVAALIDKFTEAIGLSNYALYVQDYGAPVDRKSVV